ncbi:MAG: AMP-dependent synthetase [Symbiobacteriaceae bacterium]|jgi:acyl-CoA synthetase (AMP-forming)/AMP-acid ligase II|nr:AMP-dependent synthetase [Symbiobacteriaceae bacterium]
MNRLAQLIARAGQQFARKTAFIHGDCRVTFAEAEEASNRVASALTGPLGLKPGTRVAILLPNCPEFAIADLALIKAGLVRVPINPRLAPPEVEHILADSGAEALICDAAMAVPPSVRHAVSVDELLPLGTPEPFTLPTTMDDPYMILYTSGTTGRPKGAVTTVRSRWVTLFYVYANEDFVHETDVMLHAASLAHGSGTKMLPNYIKGAANLFLPRFSMEAFCAAIQEHRVTTTWLVPAQVAMLLDFPDRPQYDLSSLRTVVYAGAPMPAERLRQAISAFGPIFVQVYGLSEAPQPALVLSKLDHHPENARRFASAGRPAIGVDVRVLREDGATVAPGSGEVGEICLYGEHLMTGYHGRPAETAEVLGDDGWFHTGDLATVDEDGYVYIVDRKKDLIISGGYNIYPREVEEVLYQHPAVAEAAVIGVPDEQWGEAVKAVVALRPGMTATAEALISHCRERLAGYKKPRSVDFVPALPRSANGKILKRELRQPYWEGRSRQV